MRAPSLKEIEDAVAASSSSEILLTLILNAYTRGKTVDILKACDNAIRTINPVKKTKKEWER